MIVIKRTEGGVTVSGHANYAENGKDIVCAAVSTLTQTLIASIEVLTADKIKYNISTGFVEIKHGILSEKAQFLMESFFIGCHMIAETYPDNVCIKE